MSKKVISLDVARQEHALKHNFGTDYQLVATFYLAKKLHSEDMNEREGELLRVDGSALHCWFQKRLADTVEERGIRKANVYKMIPYVTDVLLRRASISLSAWRPTQRYQEYLETDNVQTLLQLAEESFLVFCLYPEEQTRKIIRYREYAYTHGTQAYRVFGERRKNPFGMQMEDAFAPLGEIVREICMVPG